MLDELRDELDQLRRTYAMSKPSARLAAIRQRLSRAEGESGPTRLITTVSAVEALARSLVVHAPGRPPATAHFRYQQVRNKQPLDLVEEALRLHGGKLPAEQVGTQAWELFELAVQARNLVVHECTTLGQDKYPPMVGAAERVLEAMVEVAGLLRVVERPAAARE
ncbi:hypothetical protein ACPWT1_06655 [Ramlibacter sp. MMS24-I3-19]|uniref:hypothetical protein n=1 Tax=Ramlibacter sp. MMS24-I3-19 TaxID=3416606 RepID=UPI003CFDEC61